MRGAAVYAVVVVTAGRLQVPFPPAWPVWSFVCVLWLLPLSKDVHVRSPGDSACLSLSVGVSVGCRTDWQPVQGV